MGRLEAQHRSPHDHAGVPDVKVTFVASHFLPHIGGIELHMAELARRLADAGIDVSISCLAADTEPRSGSAVAQTAFNVRRVHSRGVGKALRWPERLVHKGSCDLIHFHGFSRPLLVRLLHDRENAPLILTPHGGVRGARADQLLPRRWLKLAFDRLLGEKWLRVPARILCLTEREQRELWSTAGIQLPSTVVLGNFPTGDRPIHHIPQGASGRLLVLARHDRIKRITDLMTALALDPSLPNCDIVGPSGNDSPRLRRMAQALSQGRIRFIEPLFDDAKGRIIREAKCLVLCSELEARSMAAQEATIQGTPIIASTGAAPGVPSNGVITYPTGNVHALIRAIQSLENDATIARLRAGAAFERSRLVSASEYSTRVLDVYSQVLNTA